MDTGDMAHAAGEEHEGEWDEVQAARYAKGKFNNTGKDKDGKGADKSSGKNSTRQAWHEDPDNSPTSVTTAVKRVRRLRNVARREKDKARKASIVSRKRMWTRQGSKLLSTSGISNFRPLFG